MHYLSVALFVLLSVGPVTQAQTKVCPCSEMCVCGCNQGLPCKCGNPVSLGPPVEPVGPPKVENFGVDQGKIGKETCYRLNARKVTRSDVLQSLSEIPQDQNFLRLTVIGPARDRERVLADLGSHPQLSLLRAKYLVQDYDPENPLIVGMGFVTTGKPTIYLQTPTGKVLHRQDDYQGPEQLTTALRKADANYNPQKDPNLSSSSLPGLVKLIPPVHPLLLLGAAGLGIGLLLKKEE